MNNETVKEDAGQDFADNGEQVDSIMFVTDLVVSFTCVIDEYLNFY
jgi:hypothetical protein